MPDKKIRIIKSKEFEALFEQELIRASFELREDVIDFFKNLKTDLPSGRDSEIVDIFLENSKLARTEFCGLCQDTGYVQVYVSLGRNTVLDFDLAETVDGIVARVYEEYKLRKSMAHPVTRENTHTNTPAFVDVELSKDQTTRVRILLKGGGSENVTRAGFLLPTASQEEVENWVVESVKLAGAKGCPPYLVGVGIGGNLAKAVAVSKKMLLLRIGEKGMDSLEREMASSVLEKVNSLPIGFQGLKFGVTALSVQLKTLPCHIATLPIAVSLGCNSVRQGEFEIV